MENIEQIVDDYMRESKIDFIALPQLATVVRLELGARKMAEVRKLTLEIVRRLYDKGLRPGDYYLGTRFDYWPDEGWQAIVARIEREWNIADGDPTLANPICWFAPRPE